jgi:hypothetical protein
MVFLPPLALPAAFGLLAAFGLALVDELFDATGFRAEALDLGAAREALVLAGLAATGESPPKSEPDSCITRNAEFNGQSGLMAGLHMVCSK